MPKRLRRKVKPAALTETVFVEPPSNKRQLDELLSKRKELRIQAKQLENEKAILRKHIRRLRRAGS